MIVIITHFYILSNIDRSLQTIEPSEHKQTKERATIFNICQSFLIDRINASISSPNFTKIIRKISEKIAQKESKTQVNIKF
jgi:hypothetical protein